MAKDTKRSSSVTDALALFNRLQSMIKQVQAGDSSHELKDTISKLASAMLSMEVTVESDLLDRVNKFAGEIRGSTIVQYPEWRNVVEVARASRKGKKKS